MLGSSRGKEPQADLRMDYMDIEQRMHAGCSITKRVALKSFSRFFGDLIESAILTDSKRLLGPRLSLLD